ncbi:hypothetical protein FJV83_24180 [Mesorhizobium sp. WSM4307]|uniref:hypothetical protein n=1 Tax=unclassified Mesorhizobium TaxID=325217 RepID=UPI00115F00E0|nr:MULTISPECIES: hypothetical protein [unclassified Mesorhizobium]TRC76890.1 hypothetical protein FJV81_14780 [Mesorhizobium sp. WSM4315]TRC81277.1 hypothetical protein FJV83_24180 [Mesorhizobium sp. WSM4307]
MVAVGDVVLLSTGLRYCVLEFLGNARGGRDARLIRKNADGTYSSFQKNAEMLIPAETPVFNPGDAVTIDGLKGTYMSREADGDVVRIMLEPRRRQLSGGGFVQIEAGIARASYALLVLQNRKV